MIHLVFLSVWERLAGVWRDQVGSTMILMAFATLPVLAAGGLAIDAGMAYMLKNQMSKALDTAGLAAGRVAFETYAEDDAEKYFYANFDADKFGAVVTSFSATFDASRETLTLSVEADMPTRFMHLFDQDNVTVGTSAVIQRANKGMELVLVMDNTGSMRFGGKMDATIAAAHDLIGIIYGNETTLPNVWVSLVPYTITVNIGGGRVNWLDPNDRIYNGADDPENGDFNNNSFSPTAWKGCVEARTAPLDQNDTIPAGANLLTTYYYPSDTDNPWPAVDETNEAMDNGTGPNLGCGPAITPLTAGRTAIDTAIGQMQPWHRGGTAGNLGLTWGWRAISPAWQGMWGGDTPADMPLAYDDPLIEKVVVMMTDGQNQFYDFPGDGPGPDGSDYTAYGRLDDFGYATLAAARQELDDRMANTCALMKAEGIVIYTLTFGSTPDAATQDLFRNCATSAAHYFHAPSNEQLSDAFHTIGNALSNLRIAE